MPWFLMVSLTHLTLGPKGHGKKVKLVDMGIKVESGKKLARYLSGMSDGDRDVLEERYG